MADEEITALREHLPWGSVDRLPSGRIRLRGRLDGKPKTIGTYTSAAQALGTATQMLRRLEGRSAGLTVGAWGKGWLDARELAGRHKSTGDTRGLWKRYILPDPIAHQLLRKIQPRHVAQWLHRLKTRKATRPAPGERGARRELDQPLGDSTLGNALSALRTPLGAAVVAGHLPANPCVGIVIDRIGTDDEEVIHLTEAEIVQVLRLPKLPERQRVIYTVAIFTGLREGELWGLHWQDVHLSDERPHVVVRYGSAARTTTKSKRVRRVDLLPPARRALASWRSRDGVDRATGHVFVGRRGPHATGYDAQWVDTWRAKCGIRAEATFHALRHTCGVHLVSGTWGRAWRLVEVQRHLGHKSVTTTEKHYARFSPEGMARTIAEAQQMWKDQGL